MKNKLGLLFFGRLDDEKGFGTILQVLTKFIQNDGYIPFQFYVFGKGKYEKDLLNLGENQKSIHFFGRQNLDKIKAISTNCQFCLMPSSFLETFGLSAVNALSMGLPVIGPAKGGLTQFISAEYDILQGKGGDDIEKLYNTLKKIIKNFNEGKINLEEEKEKAVNLAKTYNTEKRFENIQPIIGKPKKILLVSDFKSKLGGIETYIHDVAKILESKGYEVKIYGKNIPGGIIGKILKYLGFCISSLNIIDSIKLKKQVNLFMPKVIWFHSTLRRLGRLPIKATKNYDAKKIVMYHDLGYFHPYPSKVTSQDMLITPLNLKNFIKSANTKNPLKLITVIGKYFTLNLLKNQLIKSMDLHLVPSNFMERIVSDSFEIDNEKIKTLSHFIQ